MAVPLLTSTIEEQRSVFCIFDHSTFDDIEALVIVERNRQIVAPLVTTQDHACMHQYQSGATSKLRTLRALGANENSSPPMLLSSPNQISTLDNDTLLTNHTHSPEHTQLGGIYHFEEKAALEEKPATSDLHVLSSKQMKKQLLELMTEFESLQREVIAMKSVPSPQGLVEETCSNSDEVETEQPKCHFATHEVPSLNIESIATNNPDCFKDLTPEPSPRKGAQKSIHCIIL